jgi:mono/diheme cytochrome c family protein
MKRATKRAAIAALTGLLGGCGDAGGGEDGDAGATVPATASPGSGSGDDGAATTDATTDATTGSGEDDTGATTAPVDPPGPWDQGVFLPPEPQKDGDPALGYQALVTRGYISCGIPWAFFGLARPLIGPYGDGEPLPGRDGKNAEVPFNWTVHEVDGAEIVSQNCLQCHAGHWNGKLMVGLGSAEADFTDDMSALLKAVPIPDIPIPGLEQMTRFANRVKVLGPETVMRTVGTNPAEMVAVTLVAHRDRETLQWSDEELLPIPGIVVPSDPPPWWRAHKKNALFYNGMARGDHRGTMMLATALCTDDVAEAAAIDEYFHHIQAYIRSVRPPPYPYPVDAALAAAGEPVFLKNCAGCHGTYAADEADETYPNLLFPLDVVGTDPVVAEGGTKYAPYLVDWYSESFYGTITRLEPDDPFPGYMAPPLDGIWATGPFLHNGSVPTIELVLDSTRRPTYWKRVDFDSAHFDEARLGWPYVELGYGHDLAGDDERKFIYDTTQVAHTNGGHVFGDHLTPDERRAVLEYLKTI